MQKKLIAGVTFSLVLLFGGCSHTSPSASQESASHSENAVYSSVKNDKQLKKLVQKAAKEQGWRTTALGENAIIAEKFDSDNPKATTIKIGNGVVDFNNMEGTDSGDIVDLKEYIEDLLEAQQEEH